MLKSKAILGLALLTSILFVCFQLRGDEKLVDIFSVLVIPCIALLYILNVKNKSLLILISLLSYSLSDILTIFNLSIFFEYYLGNALYTIAYIALIIEIVSQLNLKILLHYFKLYLLVLVILNVYANYILITIMKSYIPEYNFPIELAYNIFTILLLTVAILNYFFRFDKKSLFLFLGALFIALSEALQIAHYYLLDEVGNLKVLFTVLIFIAYYLFYLQSDLKYNHFLAINKEPIDA